MRLVTFDIGEPCRRIFIGLWDDDYNQLVDGYVESPDDPLLDCLAYATRKLSENGLRLFPWRFGFGWEMNYGVALANRHVPWKNLEHYWKGD